MTASPQIGSAFDGSRDSESYAAPARLVVAWQHPESRLISPVGFLERDGSWFYFVYIENALRTTDFRPFIGFPSLSTRYSSRHLFPFFRQRVMSSRRPDYAPYMRTLGFSSETGQWEQLARSGGRRTGDTVQVFPEPIVGSDGRTDCCFLVHGVRHIERIYDPTVQRRIEKLDGGDTLRFHPDSENVVNSDAIWVCDEDGNPLGWVPDLLLGYVHDVLRENSYQVTVEHRNGENVPYHFRLLARLNGRLPLGYELFAGPEWRALDK